MKKCTKNIAKKCKKFKKICERANFVRYQILEFFATFCNIFCAIFHFTLRFCDFFLQIFLLPSHQRLIGYVRYNTNSYVKQRSNLTPVKLDTNKNRPETTIFGGGRFLCCLHTLIRRRSTKAAASAAYQQYQTIT